MDTQIVQYVSTGELMNALSISRSTVNRMIGRGMPYVWIGSVRRYPLQQVLDWLRATYGGQ